MFLRNWKELLTQYRKLKAEDPHALDPTFRALEEFRCLTVLWGLEDPENVQFQDSKERQHTLLAYKYLGVIWFTELPSDEVTPFKILIREDIPRTATQEKVLETFKQDDDTLGQLCKDLPKPDWVSRETLSKKVSLESFPLEVG